MSSEDKKPDYPAWFIQFLQDVLDMRDSQNDYFRGPNEYKLKVAKVKEAKVDATVLRFLNSGYVKHKEKPNTQQSSMFK